MTRSTLHTLWLSSALLLAAPAHAQTVSESGTYIGANETLQSALASVYSDNPRLQAERARLREVDENWVQARAQGRLNVSAGAEASYTNLRTPESPGSFFSPAGGGWTDGTPYAGQINVVQPIYQGGRVKALKRQAKAGILAARAGLENAENQIFLSAANAYVDVLRDQQTAEIRRNNVRVLQRQLTAANDRFEVGEGTRTDIAQSESRLAAAEAGLAQANAQLDVSRALFERLVGRPATTLAEVPNFALPMNLQEAMRLARDNNPQLLSAYYNEKAGAAAIDVAKSASRPSLSLNGTLAGSREQLLGVDQSDQAALTARVNVPIFSGGLNKSRVRQAKHAKTRLSFETRDTERAVDQTVAQIWAQMQAAREVVRTSQRQVESADIAFEGVSLEQTVGTRTQLDVLNAEQEVLNARLTLVNAERNFDSAVFQLLSVIGVFDADGIALPLEQYDHQAYLENVAYDGYEKTIDTLVPEAVQKIVPQLDDIVVEPVGAIIDGARAIELDERAEALGKGLLEVGNVAKETVDTVTGLTPAYDPRIDQADPVINSDPFPGQGAQLGDVDEVIELDLPDVPAPILRRAPRQPGTVEPLPEPLRDFEGGR